MKRIFSGLLALGLFLSGLAFISSSTDQTVNPTFAGNNFGVSIVCDPDNYAELQETSSVNPTYATISKGNMAYAYFYIQGCASQGVTINYHTESGSAIDGIDFTGVSGGVAYSSRGSDNRTYPIGISTSTTDLYLKNFQNRNYTARTFSIVIDSAYCDDGTEVPIIDSTYSSSNKTFATHKTCQVMLRGNTELECKGGTGTNKFAVYDEQLTWSNTWWEVDYDTTIAASSVFSGGHSEMDKIKKLGLGDYYVSGNTWFSEAQDSEEETSRFIIGNDNWSKWGGCSCSTRGTGWFFGCEIAYHRLDFGWAGIIESVKACRNEGNSASSYVSSAVLDSTDYVFAHSTCWFRNSNSPGCGFSLYRHYACDGEIDIRVDLYERCFDTTAPNIKDVYFDTTGNSRGVYRVCVRFNEPIQNASSTQIVGETNVNGKDLTFSYAGGDGTDTLYYECDTNSSIYEGFSFKKLILNNSMSSMGTYRGFEDVTDFAGNKLESLNIDLKNFDLSLDKRIPSIEVEQAYLSSSTPKNSQIVPVTLTKFTTGTVYYEWVKKSEVSSYLNNKDLKDFSANEKVSLRDKLKNNSKNPSNSLAGYIYITTPSQDGTTKTQVGFDNVKENGEFYLFCHAESTNPINDGNNIEIKQYGPYLIDNSNPEVSEVNDEINILSTGGFNHKLSFNVADENGIEEVRALVRDASSKNPVTYSYNNLVIDDSGKVDFTLDLQNLIDRFYHNENGEPTVNPNYGFYEINFEIKDKAGNISYAFPDYKKIYLSVQPYFDVDVRKVSGKGYGDNLYNVDAILSIEASDDNFKEQELKISVNGSDYVGDDDTHKAYSIDSRCYENKYSIAIKFNNPGYYEMSFETSGAHSNTIGVYVTDNFNDETENYKRAYSSELLLVNKVVQLNENVQFVYINSEKQIQKENYGGAINPTFSSEAACINYLKFEEYKDLRFEVLTPNTASYLNTGSGEGYNKAAGETKVASAGQVWIRYKKASSWNLNSESLNDWAYYFYANEDDGSNTIDIALLSDNLKNAIDSVCHTICDFTGKIPNASFVYLVDDEHVNPKTKAPYLNENQIAISKNAVYSQTMTGSTLANAVFSGDPNLFENTISRNIDGKDYDLPIATNLVLNCTDSTKFYIAAYSESGINYSQVQLKEGMTLKEAINSIGGASSTVTSGIYKIKEVDRSGAREYYVYVDADAPVLATTLNDDTTLTYIDSKEVTNLFASKFVLKGIGVNFNDSGEAVVNELDKSAYVALFKMPGQSLYGIYYRGEIPSENIEEGTYLVCVGDRCGNSFSFIAYISNSDPEVKFKSFDTKFTVSITNRSIDELQSVEVYCNDVLLSTKLMTEQTFTQNGNYKVVLVDKYGIEKTFEESFLRTPPSINFYYDENNDGYFSRYVESNTDFMTIEYQENYQLISTSRRLKIVINSDECDFQINGLLPSEYTYNEDTHEIEIKTIAPFYLDIWNSVQTEDILSYKIIVDNFAPTINVTTDNRNLVYDETNAENYTKGDNPQPTSIKFNTGGQVVETRVGQDDVVSNEYVNVTIGDETGIREIRLYQKDVLVKTYTKENIEGNELSFYVGNKLGDVKIIATDLFGNTTSYAFKFAEKKLSEAYIDGSGISPDLENIYYGNDEVIVDVVSGSHIHLLYEIDGVQYNEVYKYENSNLYIGTYSTSKSGLVDFFNGGLNNSTDPEKPEYVDKPLVLDTNYTYQPHNNFGLRIVADPLTSQLKIVFDADNTANKIAMRVNKGNSIAEYYEFELSKEAGELNFDATDGQAIISDDLILLNTDNVDITYNENKIDAIVVAYNPISNDFDEDSYVYNLSNMFENGEGYYCIKVTNIYHTETYYRLIYSSSINASIDLAYQDKANEVYTISYADEFSANSKATIKGYKLNKLEGVCDDGSKISSIVVGDESTLVIEKSSVVTLEDIFGNVKVVHIYIDSDEDFKYDSDDEWITGFSELANAKEGYTNNILSIALDEEDLKTLGIVQVRVKCEDEIETLYGYDGLKFVGYNVDNFADRIGLKGTNLYTVMFSNKFGDVVTKEIHYSEESSLIINRQTSSSVGAETISVEDALNDGVWSNRLITLSSALNNSNLYKIYVKGGTDTDYKEVTLPHTFELSATSQNGLFVYTIKYVDAYGYSHEIVCNLNKQDIVYSTPNMNFITINQIDYTKDPIQIKFGDDCVATYKLNNGDPIDYISNEAIHKDGAYSFTIKDISGNVKNIDFTKDSSCKFKIASGNGEIVAYNGGVINAYTLTFDNLGDTSRIKLVRFNGNIIELGDGLSFTKTGYYECIIEDDVHNSTYFHFYLINHSISSFDYDVPSAYEISEVYRTYNNSRVAYMGVVTGNTNLKLTADGKYDIVLRNIYQDSTVNFTIEINTEAPIATLVGCEEGDVTTNDITLKDVALDDVVEVYRDGELVARYDDESESNFQTITEGGEYKIIVTNAQGVAKELCFTKKRIANTALSILITVICLLSAGGFFIGLMLRNRSKFDK